MTWSLSNSKNDEASKQSHDNEAKCSDGRPVLVYGLASSRNGEIRYIGQTTQRAEKRLDSHINCPRTKRRYVWNWIHREMCDGYKISVQRLVENAVWNETERLIISQFKATGARLVNLSDGGEGVLGRRKSAEERAKISAAHKGRKKSLEHIEKIAATRRGKPLSDEHKAKLSAALKGKMPSNLESLWAKSRGNPWSEDQRRAIMAAHAVRKLRSHNGLVTCE